MMLKAIALIAIGMFVLVVLRWGWNQIYSFHAQSPADYAGKVPEFDIRIVLNGTLDAHGMVYDYSGRVTARFTAQMAGSWDASTGTIKESFRYDSGRTQLREWTIVMAENGAFTATAPDIIGVATGQQAGNVARLSYRIKLPPEAGGYQLDVVDWMYLVADGVILNKSEFRKFGLKVGELVATFRPAAD